MDRAKVIPIVVVVALAALLGACYACSVEPQKTSVERESIEASDVMAEESTSGSQAESESLRSAAAEGGELGDAGESDASANAKQMGSTSATATELYEALGVVEDYRSSFVHGDKRASHQKYIVLHDTEGESGPQSVIDFWDGNGNLVAAHFVVGKDGSIAQCVPLDNIAHHAGYGDAGHNDLYGIVEDGRDDMAGSVPIGSWAPDYGMNAWSIGIEMVHVGGTGYYPEEQLEAVDRLIAYIDAYYGFESAIIDHKAWRSGNSDTSPEFASYLANYQDHRTHL